MIVRPKPNWLRMLFVWRGSVLSKIMPQLIFTTLLSILVVIFHGELLNRKITLTAVPFSLVGVALAIFLGFRNSASYDRYWEARKLWGKLLIESRDAIRQYVSFGCSEPVVFAKALAAYVHAIRHQLRQSDPRPDLQRLLPEPVFQQVSGQRTPATHILMWLGQHLKAQRDTAELPALLAGVIDRSLTGLNEAHGGCERIASTPLPFTYSVILHRTVYLYCLLLPFGLLDSIGVMTPVMVCFVAYTFFAIEALGDEIEEPFGTMANDLALDAMSTAIEVSLREMVGERDLPPLVEPVDFVLT